MHIRTLFCLCLLTTQVLGQQPVNPLSSCTIPLACQDGLLKFANDFLPPISPDCKLWEGACGINNVITREGKVTIGGTAGGGYHYGDYKLAVWGNIISEELRICQSAWCDYVFEDTFRLMPLREVRTWIEKEQHLPGCTPAAFIEQDSGYQIERLVLEQQRKIEEAFLYLIDLDKRLKNLDSRFQGPAVPAKSGMETANADIQSRTNLSGSDEKVSSYPTTGALIAPYDCSKLSQPACKEALTTFFQNNLTTAECKQWLGGCGTSVGSKIYRSGPVCIGTQATRGGYSLFVWGGIITDKFRIALGGSAWCDYVFSPNYPLLSLSALESFVKSNKHLPGMITQEVVKKEEGYDMKKVKLQQQEKIEEAYLHLIDLQNRRKALENRLLELN